MTIGLNEAQIQQVRAEFRRTGNAAEVARRIGISSSTVGVYVRDLRAPVEKFPVGDLSWQDRAACLGYPVETFFPNGPSDKAWIEEATSICRGCPVVAACGDYAKKTNSVGVWAAKYIPSKGPREGVEQAA